MENLQFFWGKFGIRQLRERLVSVVSKPQFLVSLVPGSCEFQRECFLVKQFKLLNFYSFTSSIQFFFFSSPKKSFFAENGL